MTTTEIHLLGAAIAQRGFSAERAKQAALYAGARRRGVPLSLVAVAADPTEDPATRLRALDRVIEEYCWILDQLTDQVDLRDVSAPQAEIDLTTAAEPVIVATERPTHQSAV